MHFPFKTASAPAAASSPFAKIALTLVVVFVSSSPAEAALDHDLQLWTPVSLDAPVYKKLHAYCEASPRLGENITQCNQVFIRPSLEYRARRGCSLFAGYAWFDYIAPSRIQENRLWQQTLFYKDFKKLTVFNRTRLEERFFSHLPQAGVRLRHFIKLTYPITKKVYAAASEELFINLNSVEDGPQKGIDQNRLFAGVGIKWTKKVRTEIGYQLQYINRSDPSDDLANHAIVIQTYAGLRD